MDHSDCRHPQWSHKILQKLAHRGLSLKHFEERVIQFFKISPSELRMVMGAVLLSSFVIILAKGCQSRDSGKDLAPAVEISTLIPAGQVLIPIQLKNFESVDSILGPFGRVDLYTQGKNGKSRLVAQNIKLLRAPKNPSLFAVLAPQEESPKIIHADEEGLYAVIKNKQQIGTEFVNAPVKASVKTSRITYGMED